MSNIFQYFKPKPKSWESSDEAQFFLIAGPCAVESYDMVDEIALFLKDLCNRLAIPLIFKASYRKANRSRLNSFTGIGDETALSILKKVKEKHKLVITTDIHEPSEALVAAEVVDVLQIPAFLCRQTDLLVAAAKTDKVVNIKKGQFLSPEAIQFALQKVRDSGNHKVGIIERGSCFGYGDLIVDFRGIPIMKNFDAPVIVDCTHSMQKPNQLAGVTGGLPQYIPTIAKAAIAAGADGLFIETHPNPKDALSDGANMLPLYQLPDLLSTLIKIRKAVL